MQKANDRRPVVAIALMTLRGHGELIIIIRWQNFQIKFTIPADELVKLTTHWDIWDKIKNIS